MSLFIKLYFYKFFGSYFSIKFGKKNKFHKTILRSLRNLSENVRSIEYTVCKIEEPKIENAEAVKEQVIEEVKEKKATKKEPEIKKTKRDIKQDRKDLIKKYNEQGRIWQPSRGNLSRYYFILNHKLT